MIQDAFTVAWKEWQLLGRGSSRGRLWAFALPVIVGIVMPLQTGRAWLETPAAIGSWAVIPLILVGPWVADAFAGERERHTLETLLATRLSDRGILLGKIGAVAAYAWLASLVAFLAGAVTANVAFWQGGVQFYTLPITLAGVGFSLLFSLLAANAGVLVCLRAPTVRQAQQIITFGLLGVIWLPIIGLNLARDYLPKGWLTSLLSESDLLTMVLAALAVLLAVVVLLFLAALARFQRARLILD